MGCFSYQNRIIAQPGGPFTVKDIQSGRRLHRYQLFVHGHLLIPVTVGILVLVRTDFGFLLPQSKERKSIIKQY